jgi:GNAT superfamily N-acetyltransferase
LQSVGNALCDYLQRDLVSHKSVQAIGLEYPEDHADAPAIEKIVIEQGWSLPKRYLIRCHFTLASFNPDWFQRLLAYPLPSAYTLFQWDELTLSEKKRISHMVEQGMVLPFLSPYFHDQPIERINSLGLRYKGTLIGWCITHRLDETTVRYSTLFVDKDFHMKGIAIRLLAAAIQLQKQSPIPFGLFEANLQKIDRPWRSFIDKRLIPYADKVEKMKWTVRFL